MSDNLFRSPSGLNRFREELPVGSPISAKDLENYSPGASEDLWKNDPIGIGLKNTQQLLVDWSKYEEHVFFNSAEGKINLAFDQIINGYPFDGTSLEKNEFLSNIGGFTKYILGQFDTNNGYFNFGDDTSAPNVFLQIEDQTGKLVPDLAKVVGDARATKDFHTNGTTHEFWVYLPSSLGTGTKRTVYQKKAASSNIKGVSIYTERATRTIDGVSTEVFDVSFHISSDNFKAIKHTISNLVTNKWHHVAFTYERGTTERVSGYVDGNLNSYTDNSQAELDDIQMGDGIIRVGYGLTHTSHADSSWAASNHFRGLLDEFRVWATVRGQKEIKSNMHKNIDSQTHLALYYRFSEPTTTTTYSASSVVLDYSGNSLHAVIQNLSSSHDPKGAYGSVATPLKLEDPKDNPVLFPDWPVNSALNRQMLLDANQYDRNNPNLITKLVPQHYFEDAQYFEGIESAFEEPKEMGTQGVDNAIPGHGKMPTRVVMLSILLVWANFFDDIKLFIDNFSNLNKVTYDTYNQIPPQLIQFLSDYYGIHLPNPYTKENLEKYKDGKNLENESSIGTPLSETIDQMWRRILINLPWLLRSRGTVQGLKGLINTLGIESDSIFKFREYGGAISKKITSGRKKVKKKCGFLDFSKLTYIESAPLWAYRHEPGGDDPASGPAPGEVIFQSGDITITTPAGPPVPTLFTSGSWAYEGRYTLLPTETTASLLRIENDTSVMANLVAMRAKNSNGVDFNLRLFLDGHQTASNPVELDLPNVNLWDGNPWYISVNNVWGATKNTLELRCMKTSGEYIVEHYSSSIDYTKNAAALSGTTLHNGIPLFAIDNASPATNANKIKFAVGTNSGKTFSTGAGSLNYSTLSTAKRAQSHHTSYSGQLSHMRFWTKSITRSEQIEHAYNPFSVATKEPINSYAFPNKPIVQLNNTGQSGHGAPYEYETIPLGKYSGTYTGALPEGSWDRIRQSFDMLQPGYTFNANQLTLIDTTQNNDHVTLYGQDGGLFKKEFIFTIVGSDFDSNSTSNKVRIRSFQDKSTAKDQFAHFGILTSLPIETGIDDRRFSIESSLVHALDDDMANVVGNLNILNNYLGAPELEYAVEYPEIRKLQDLYFQRLVGKPNYNAVLEFQRWFNNNFASLIEQFIPHTADFLGINFVIESHMLERHKMEYKQGDVHVDILDRVAFEQEPLFIGAVRREIT